MADESEEIITRLKLEADQALTQWEILRENVEAYKKQIVELKATTKGTFEDIATSMKRANDAVSRSTDTKALGLAVSELNRQQKEQVAGITQNLKLEQEAQRQAGEEAKKSYAGASVAAQQYRAQVNQVKQELQSISKTTGLSLQDVAKGMTASGRFSTTAVTQGLKELQGETQKTSQGFLGLGTVANFVFGTILGLTAVTVLRNVINFLKEATQAGIDFMKATFQMEVGIRALQRSGVDITIKDIYDNLEKLKESFGVFSMVELVKGSAALMNLIRDMGFTKDQIIELQKTIAVLATVNGRAMDEVQRTVALALSSGYTEGLQRLGVSINRVNIAERAAQMGWKGGYLALTEHQRALATYSLMLEKTAKYQEDFQAYQKTLPGQIETANAAIKDQTAALGTNLSIFGLLWAKIKLTAIELLKISVIGQMGRFFTGMFAVFTWLHDIFVTLIPQLKSVSGGFENLGKTISSVFSGKWASGVIDTWINKLEHLKGTNETWNKVLDKTIDLLEKIQSLTTGMPAGSLGNTEVATTTGLDTAQLQDVQDAYDGMIKAIDEETQKGLEDNRKLWDDYAKDIRSIVQKLADDLADIERDYQRRLIDIDIKLQQQQEDEAVDYANRVADASAQANQRRADAEARYRNNEITAEIKYQEKLRQLREGFLMDLEDAVRERDARQIIRLTRQYNLEKKQTDREEQQRKEQAARDHALEMQRIEAERKERAKQLALEHQQRLREMALQADRERAQALRDKQEKEADRIAEEQADLARRTEQYKVEKEALAQAIKDRLDQIVQGFIDQYNLSGVQLATLFEQLSAYYGDSGLIRELYSNATDYIIGKSSQAVGAMLQLLAVLNMVQSASGAQPWSIPGGTYNPNWTGGSVNSQPPKPATDPGDGYEWVWNGSSWVKRKIRGFASGGVAYADTPTTVQFGEVPEIATFTPLSQLNQFKPSVGSGKGLQGHVVVELSPDLEARIVERTYQGQADMIMTVERQRR